EGEGPERAGQDAAAAAHGGRPVDVPARLLHHVRGEQPLLGGVERGRGGDRLRRRRRLPAALRRGARGFRGGDQRRLRAEEGRKEGREEGPEGQEGREEGRRRHGE